MNATATSIENIEGSWSLIESVSHSMREAASRAEWPEVLEFATSRHHRLLSHFENFPVGPDNADFYSLRLHGMLEREKELQEITLNARRELMRSSIATSKNLRAVNAYLDDRRSSLES